MGKIKIGLVFGFGGCHFIGIGLVLVCNFLENGISSHCAGQEAGHCAGQAAGHCASLQAPFCCSHRE